VATKWGKANSVNLLLDNGAKIDVKTRDGLTPLHCAARSGHDQVVELLISRNAPINAKTKNGLTALHMAAQGDHVEAARILLYHSPKLVDQTTCDFLTALHVAAHCGHVKIAKLLLDHKADVNSRALNGFTPLHIACKKNRIKVIELLIKHGAFKEATTKSRPCSGLVHGLHECGRVSNTTRRAAQRAHDSRRNTAAFGRTSYPDRHCAHSAATRRSR
jgi:ankyrin